MHGPYTCEAGSGEGLLFTYVNHGKKSITLNPETPTGRHVFNRLAAKCDLLIETELSKSGDMAVFVGGLREANPRLGIVSLTHAGRDGRLSEAKHSPLTVQHRSG